MEFEDFKEIGKRINELKNNSNEDLIFYIKIINKYGGKAVINDDDNLYLKDNKQIINIFFDSISQATEVSRGRFDKFQFTLQEALYIDDLLDTIILEKKRTPSTKKVLSKIYNDQRALLFVITILRYSLTNKIINITKDSIRGHFIKSEFINLKGQTSRFGKDRREHYSLNKLIKENEFDSNLYYFIYDSLENHIINEPLSCQKTIDAIQTILNHYEHAERNVITSWEIVKNRDEEVQDWLIKKLEKRYYIIRNQSLITSEQKAILIVLYLDMMYTAFEESNYNVKIKALKDEFSRKKISNKNRLNLDIDKKHWQQLAELSGGETKGKMRKQLHKLISEAYRLK
ncbi:hypothetical protein M2G95_06015 [Vibrio vulnificus]|nr:hypothetical protein [Vibrio vulnificus]